MLRYIVKRVLQAIPLLIVISIICFLLIQMSPYDAIDTIATPKMSEEAKAALKAEYGLDQPAYVQYWRWITHMAKGDMGYSLVNHLSVAEAMSAQLPNTVILVLPAFALAILIAIVVGLIAGSNRGGRFDKFTDFMCSLGMATPTFWIGMMLLYIFAYKLALLPVLGMHTMGQENNWRDTLQHSILPWTVLTISFLPGMIRFVRSSTISQYREDYVMVQQAFGASRMQILFRHVIKNVLLPIITLVGYQLPTLITGAVITESIFSWPGMGAYFANAIKAFDYPVIMTVMLFSSAMVIIGNLLADVCYCLVDPRIKSMG